MKTDEMKRHVLFAAFEAVPFFKSGGLGDVAGTLPHYLNNDNYETRLILPKLWCIDEKYRNLMEFKRFFYVPLGWRREYCGLFELKYKNLKIYFLDNEYYFKRDKAYGYYDDGERIAYFSKAVVEAMEYLDWRVDILHCNDWHTALSTVFLREHYMKIDSFKNIKTVFNIHNIKFQGQFSDFCLYDILGLEHSPAEKQMCIYNKYSNKREAVNYMRGALHYSDRIVAVSPTYANEIKMPYYGEGVDPILRERSSIVRGILNGIDTDFFDPGLDRLINTNYTADSVSIKFKNKLALQAELGLRVDKKIPLYSIISRFTEQKGLDLVLDKLADIENREMQLVVLGVGDKKYEDAFRYYASKRPDKFAALIYFDENMSHKIYAASDAFLMPSRFEPCGLSQMIAMRYATIPIVRETGGLKDTVVPFNEYDNTGSGFSFTNYNADEMMRTIDYSLHVYYDMPQSWTKLQKNAARLDFSWEKSANEYMKMYEEMF